ncbi:fimbrial protein [Pseudomonas sp. MS19]|uniref:fimbrial protein n=1 Tax=Pseudomonas sp. MS19 TaxID=2579939 RepID=UPI001562C83F|nr:fimbrial protein [Pseudomonas sp. MS19]
MKTILSSALFSVSVMTAGVATASDGTVNFIGSVIGQSCNIDISQGQAQNGVGPNALVTLPTLGISALPNEGSKAGSTSFLFLLSDCTPGMMVRPFFESTNVNPASGYLLNTVSTANGGSSDVELEILNVNDESIDLRTNPESTNSYQDITSAGNAVMEYNVQYTAGVNPTSGTVSSALTYTLQYR